VKDLDRLIKEVWPKVRRRHLFPELPVPVSTEGEERVGLDIKGKKISISENFIRHMAPELEPQEVLEGLLDHAVSHYLYCPWDFSTHLKLYGEAKRVLKDKSMAQKATDCFMDVVADTSCISEKETPLPNVYRHLEKDQLDEAIQALYQKIWGMDLGVEGHEDVSRKLSRLPYLERTEWKDSIRRFAKVIGSLMEMEESEQTSSGDSDSLDKHDLRQYSADEIQQGLETLAVESGSPTEFKELIEDFEDEIMEAAQLPGEGMGRGPGQSLDANLLYYMKLAENYSLPIQMSPMEKSGSLYPYQHVPWEVGRPYQDIDPWTSFGKIMPGVTQTWQRTEGEVFSREEGVPDCMVVIDSSGSMPDPSRQLSHAVLGAACACDAYLRKEAQVAVYNFSDAAAGGGKILPYSRERKAVYQAICHYFGGGTEVLVEHIEALQTDRVPDIFLITDMQINNLQHLIEYFNGCSNRVTAVHIGKNKRSDIFRRSMAPRGNVGIYEVERREDVPTIVLGKVRQYLRGVREKS